MSVRKLIVTASLAFVALYAYALRRIRRFEYLDLHDANVPGSYVAVGGSRVHYVEAGRGDPVVLIHGIFASTFSFRHTIPELAQQHRVVAVDLRGFGYTDMPEDAGYSLTAQATLVHQAMARLGIERAAVVGHSMGGDIAMRLALLHPESVTRLVLVDSVTEHEMSRARSGRFVRPLLSLIAGLSLSTRSVRRGLRSAVHDPAHATDDVVAGYELPMHVKGRLRALGALIAHRHRDLPVEPERITQPTLVLWGEHDRWIPLERGQELARRIPNARLAVVRSAGHLPLEEQPVDTTKTLVEFLRAEAPPATEIVAAEVETV
ncbi:MAG: alpha/beta hydrolase [Dehalococcoidia bacterium]